MKLGIFGDSYADVNGDTNFLSWPNLLYKKYPSTIIEARCGISHWWTYNKFIESIEQNNFTHVIFCHTGQHRWPCLPEELEGNNWNIHSHHNASFNESLGLLNKFYWDIFPNKFINFISENIFRSVNEYCLKNNIYLINIICFRQVPYEYQTSFPVLYDLDSVSHQEKINYKGKEYTFLEFIKDYPMEHGDPRICHFGDINNKKVSDIMSNLIETKPYNLYYDLYKEFDWDVYDQSNDERFAKELEKCK